MLKRRVWQGPGGDWQEPSTAFTGASPITKPLCVKGELCGCWWWVVTIRARVRVVDNAA